MDLEESIYIISDVLEEYMDSRSYNRYLLDNILLAIDNKAISYKEYKNSNKKVINNKSENEIITENNNILKDFLNKKKGGS